MTRNSIIAVSIEQPKAKFEEAKKSINAANLNQEKELLSKLPLPERGSTDLPLTLNVQLSNSENIYQMEIDREKTGWDFMNAISTRFALLHKKIELSIVNDQGLEEPLDIEKSLGSLSGGIRLVKVNVINIGYGESRLSRKESFLGHSRKQSNRFDGDELILSVTQGPSDILVSLDKMKEEALIRRSSTRRRSSIISSINVSMAPLKRLISNSARRVSQISSGIVEEAEETPKEESQMGTSTVSLHTFLNQQGLPSVRPKSFNEKNHDSAHKHREASIFVPTIIEEQEHNQGSLEFEPQSDEKETPEEMKDVETQILFTDNAANPVNLPSQNNDEIQKKHIPKTENTENIQQVRGLSSDIRQHHNMSSNQFQRPTLAFRIPDANHFSIAIQETRASLEKDIHKASSFSNSDAIDTISIAQKDNCENQDGENQNLDKNETLAVNTNVPSSPSEVSNLSPTDFYSNILENYQPHSPGDTDPLPNNPIHRTDNRLSYDPKLSTSRSTLRRSQLPLSKAQSALAGSMSDSSINSTILKISLPDQQVTFVKIPEDILLEDVLLHVCKKRNMDFAKYTLAEVDETASLELDRTLGHFFNSRPEKLKGSHIKVIESVKAYTTMSEKEGEKEVMIYKISNGKIMVMAATADKMIEHLTSQEKDDALLDTVLLTFRSFMTPTECFARLLDRFDCVLPPSPTKEDVDFFKKMKRPTQKRVIEILNIWVERHWQDFAVDFTLKNELQLFVNRLMMDKTLEFQSEGFMLRNAMGFQADVFDTIISSYKATERRGKIMESMFDKLTYEDLSEQLCLHNFKLFKNIKPTDFLQQIWNPKKADEETSTPILDFFIGRFDMECNWIATEIVHIKDLKKRTAALKKIIRTAKLCLEHKNFFSFFAIIGGLNLGPVTRLKKTWDSISDRTKKTYEEITRVIDPSRNMKNFRDIISKTTPPMIPFIPIYLKDLTFMNDGNPSKIRDMVNLEKLRMMGNCVKSISDLASFEFKFKANPEIQNYLSKPPVERDLQKLKKLSLECEP